MDRSMELKIKAAAALIECFPDTTWMPNKAGNKEAMKDLATLKRRPFASQVEQGILPLTTSLEMYKFAVLLGEMGIGKTQISYSAAFLALKNAKNRKLLFLTAGGKHLPKMRKEAIAIYGKNNCIVKTVVNKLPGEKISSDQIIPEDIKNDVVPEGKIIVYLLSKDTAKMDLSEEPIYNYGDRCPSCSEKILPKTWKKGKVLNTKIKPYECPSCSVSLVSKVGKNICQHAYEAGIPVTGQKILTYSFDKAGNGLLDESGKPVIKEDYRVGIFPNRLSSQRTSGSRKISVGKRLKRTMNNSKDKIFEMIIVDEVHEMQSGTSLQGKVYRDLVNVSRRALIMTGTLSNGYSSSTFYILQAIMPQYFKDNGYSFHDVSKFVDHYGARKTVKTKDIIETKGSKVIVKINEVPKISERIVSLMAPFTVWIKMEDLNLKMPKYSERSVITPMDDDLLKAMNEYRVEAVSKLSKHNPKLIKSFASRFMYLQNNPTFPYNFTFEGVKEVVDDITSEVSFVKDNFSVPFSAFDEESLFNKEREMLDELERQMKRDRAVLIYSIYNKAALVSDRIFKIIANDERFKDLVVKIMPDSVSGENIEKWIDENPCDALIASPLKLATGLDLCQFPTIFFYETGTNLRVIQQAARRSWRAVGQSKPVEVVFFAYEGLQSNILTVTAKKMKAAATVEGKKVTEGQLAQEFDDDVDFTAALNSIADEIQTSLVPDFSSSVIEEGKLRPLTKLEAEYEALCVEYDLDNKRDDSEDEEEIEEDNSEDEIEVKEEAPVKAKRTRTVKTKETINVETIPEIKLEEVVEAEKISEEDVPSKETVVESQEEVEIEVEVDASNGQLYFKF